MGNSLRFALVTTFYPPHHFGGDAMFVRLLAQALVRCGHRVDVITDIDGYRTLTDRLSRDPNPEPEPPGLTVHRLRSRLGPLSVLATQQLGRPLFHARALRRIFEQDFDVIHYHNISLVGGPGILSYGSAIKLYTAHEHWLVCPTHVLWRHNREICTERQCFRCVLKYKRPPQIWRRTGLLERMATHVDAFCSPSRFSADQHREFGFPFPLEVLAPFIPDQPRSDNEMHSSLTDRANKLPFFLFAGRLEKIKGLQDVIPSFRDQSSAELWIAGSGTYESTLRKLHGKDHAIRFLGAVPPEKMAALYRQALALIVPSLSYEVFPMVLLEAFREGTPVIARRLGPLPEVLKQSGGGLLFADRAELEGALKAMVSNSGLRSSLSRAARSAFEARWTEASFMNRYFSLLSRAATRKGGNSASKILAACPAIEEVP